MNRQIKFRVWDNELKFMHICGNDTHDSMDFFDNIATYYNLQNGCGSLKDSDGKSTYELMQYTGLRDKNGTEGYEYDILDTHAGKAVIKFGEYGGAGAIDKYNLGFYVDFLDEFKNSMWRHELGYWLPQSAIIGNTFTSPDLLGEGDA